MYPRLRVFIVVLIAAVAPARSGVLHAAEVRVGVLAGANLANMDWKSLDAALEANGSDLTKRTGVCVGTAVEMPLSRNASVRLEPMFVTNGTNFRGFGGVGKFHVKSSYFEVPVLLRLPSERNRPHPYVILGPTLGLKLSATSNDDDIGGESIGTIFRRWEFGVTGGAGLSLPVGDHALFVEARYARGLSSAIRSSDIKNIGIQLLTGLAFGR